MTRKDYRLIAEAVRAAYDRCDTDVEAVGVDRVVEELCRALPGDNFRFDASRFRDACEASAAVR